MACEAPCDLGWVMRELYLLSCCATRRTPRMFSGAAVSAFAASRMRRIACNGQDWDAKPSIVTGLFPLCNRRGWLAKRAEFAEYQTGFHHLMSIIHCTGAR